MRYIFIFIFILTSSFATYSQSKLDPELKIKDEEITSASYKEAISFLQDNVPKILKDKKKLDRILQSSEFWISYSNSLKIIQAYVLKKDAIFESQPQKMRSTKAQIKYREFLEKTFYAD